MNKKVFSLLAAGAITTSMLSGVAAHALGQEGSKKVDVTYNNTTAIPDPDNPGQAQWQVAIPSGINFTDEKKEVKADVELQNADGGTYVGDAQVKVKVTSENVYKLKKGASEIDYTLGYNSKTMTNESPDIGTLNQAGAKVEGTAKLGDTNNATELGQHTDKLTYTVQKTN